MEGPSFQHQLRLVLQLVEALQHLHQRGITHRDVKPHNILVFNGGRTVKLADFGVSTSIAEAKHAFRSIPLSSSCNVLDSNSSWLVMMGHD